MHVARQLQQSQSRAAQTPQQPGYFTEDTVVGTDTDLTSEADVVFGAQGTVSSAGRKDEHQEESRQPLKGSM